MSKSKPDPEPDPLDRAPPDADRVTFTRESFHILRRQIRQGWGVPDELRTEALFQVAKVLTTSKHERNKIAAAKFLKELDLEERREDRKDTELSVETTETVHPAAALAALKALNDVAGSPTAEPPPDAPVGPGHPPGD